MRRVGEAFTLIELLVVIAIVAILVALVMPSLGSARRTARAMQCGTAMREIGAAWSVYASDNGGRGPGRARRGETRHGGDFAWMDILNYDIFGFPLTTAGSGGPVQRFYMDVTAEPPRRQPGPRHLVCPEMMMTANSDWARPMIANANAVGGRNYGGDGWNHGYPGGTGCEYGQIAERHSFFERMMLGTQLGRFARPSRTFLVVESHRGHDDTNDLVPRASGLRPFDATPEWPVGGWTAFRHPNLTANFLMIDGSVQRMGNRDPAILVADHWRVE